MLAERGSGLGFGRAGALTSRGFVVGLSLLLLNDFVLKALFHNRLTGKLSDFAGLFVFPLFWSALFPRLRRHVYLLTAAAFVYWKSPYSQTLIDAWNASALPHLGRAVDASDLLALLVLPPSYLYSVKKDAAVSRRLAPYAVAALSLVAFAATSYHSDFQYDNKYRFQMSRVELTRRVFNLRRLDKVYRVQPCGFENVTPDKLEVTIPSDFCFDSVDATIGIGEEQGQSVITLKQMKHECPEGRGDKEKLLSVFESEFIAKLSQSSPAFPIDELPEGQPVKAERPRRLYLVPLGELSGVNVKELAAYLRRQSGADVQVLRALPLTAAARDPRFPDARPQAERMVDYMSAEYPKPAAEPGAVMVGIAQDFYAEGAGDFYPSHYVKGAGLAVVSLDALNPATFCEPPDAELLNTRLRKLLAKLYSDAAAPPAG